MGPGVLRRQQNGGTVRAVITAGGLVEGDGWVYLGFRGVEQIPWLYDSICAVCEAFGLAPERIAVTQRLAELQIKAGDSKRALRTLEKGWAVAPHPDLAELYLKASGETEALKRIAIVRRLALQNAASVRAVQTRRCAVWRARPRCACRDGAGIGACVPDAVLGRICGERCGN